MMLGTEDEAFLEDPLKKRKPSVSMGAATAQAGANVPGMDSVAAGLVGNQHANRDAAQAAQPGMSGFNDPISMSLAEPPPAASPLRPRPTVGHQPRASSTSAMTQSPVDIAKAGGVTPPAPGAPPAPGPQAQMAAAIEAQKPLIDDQRQNYQADTALKQQTLADRRAVEQRKQGQKFQHSLTKGKITGVKPSDPQALSERRIGTDGRAIVSTPNLDAAGMPAPNANATIADQQSRIAERISASPGVQAAKNRIVQETLARNGQQIADRTNIADTGTIAVDPRHAGPGQLTTSGYQPGAPQKAGPDTKFAQGFGIVPKQPASQTVMKAPLRPRKVSQSAVVNPRINPLFKTAVA